MRHAKRRACNKHENKRPEIGGFRAPGHPCSRKRVKEILARFRAKQRPQPHGNAQQHHQRDYARNPSWHVCAGGCAVARFLDILDAVIHIIFLQRLYAFTSFRNWLRRRLPLSDGGLALLTAAFVHHFAAIRGYIRLAAMEREDKHTPVSTLRFIDFATVCASEVSYSLGFGKDCHIFVRHPESGCKRVGNAIQ